LAEKTYKCLSPLGYQEPIEFHPLSPRLDKLDGKTIYLCINAGGDQDITIPLVKKLPEKYPNVNWKIKRTYGFSSTLTPEERKEADAIVAGVIW
jgi:hypothetical protein